MNKTTPTMNLVEALKAVKAYMENDNPSTAPVKEYEELSSADFHDIIDRIGNADLAPGEYASLVKFAATELDNLQLRECLNRSKDEFTFLRQRLGVSQQWVAAKLDLSSSTVRRWEDPLIPYMPSEKAWALLKRLEEKEDKIAQTALNDKFHSIDQALKNCGIVFKGMIQPITPTIKLHNFRDEIQFQKLVEMKTREYDPSDPDDGTRYQDDYADNNLWSVFPEAETYTIQNAITNRMYEQVKYGLHDFPNITTVTVSFTPGQVVQIISVTDANGEKVGAARVVL